MPEPITTYAELRAACTDIADAFGFDLPCIDDDFLVFMKACAAELRTLRLMMPQMRQTSHDTYGARLLIVDSDRTRVSDSVVFWRSNGRGYTVFLDEAGRYTEHECRNRFDDKSFAIDESAIASQTVRPIVLLSSLEALRANTVRVERS